MKKILSLGLSLVLAAATLAACNTERLDRDFEQRQKTAVTEVDTAKRPAEIVRHDSLQITDQVWTGQKAVRTRRGQALPERFETTNAFVLSSAKPLTLREIADEIAQQSRIPVRLADGADTAAAAPRAGAVGGASRPAAGAANNNDAMPIQWQGPLSGLLERVAGNFGLSWRYDGAAIVFSRFETRIFTIYSMPGTVEITDGLTGELEGGVQGGGTTASNNGGGIKQSADLSAKIEFWSELEKTMQAVLGGVGSFQVAPSTGTVTVITTPEIMRQVASFIDDQNVQLTKQVAINVEVFSLDLNDDVDFNFDLNAIVRQTSNFPSFEWTGATIPGVSAAERAGGLGVTILGRNRATTGSDAVLRALATKGKVSRVAQLPVTTLNNRPATRRIGVDRAYLASVETSTSQSFQSTSLEPGIIRQGYSLQLTPRILDDGRILLQYSLSVIDLLGIEPFSSGTGQNSSSIQLPETASRIFVQQAMLQSGQTLVLSGVDQNDITQDRSGVGSPFNMLLGGRNANTESRRMLFISITPQEVDIGQPSAESRG